MKDGIPQSFTRRLEKNTGLHAHLPAKCLALFGFAMPCGADWCTSGASMIDEDAFGLLIAYLNIEDDEYEGEREHFVARFRSFSTLLRARLSDQPPGGAARAIELGHAFYVEVIEGDVEGDLISWLRNTRSALSEAGYVTAGILTYGSTWVDEQQQPLTELGVCRLMTASGPSEPLRRALYAEGASRGDEDMGTPGWGPGLYLDVEAVETLGRKPKNEPTILRAAAAGYYRVGS